jgi:hypothetical protein
VSGNPYIDAQKKKFDALRDSITGIQTRASEENRGITDEELQLIRSQGETANAIAREIETLTEIETRSQQVDRMAASLLTNAGDGGSPAAGGTQQDRSGGAPLGTTQTRDRDPGLYLREKEGGRHSFFGDLYRSQQGDADATERMAVHTRALSTGGQGVGVVPPKWMTEEFMTLARQGRALANAVRNIPLGNDPRPLTLPKQISGTDNVVGEQPAENDPVNGTDAWDSDVDVVTPKATAGKQVVSRQMLDMSSPAVDQLIFGDLISVYNMKIEHKVGAAMLTAAGAPVVTFATNAAFATDAAAIDAVIDAAIAVRNAHKMPANILVSTVNRWGEFKKLKDSTNRPLIPVSKYGPANVNGIGEVNTDGEIESLQVISTDGVGNGTTFPESFLVARSTDTILFETDVMRFRYEEQAGPESIVLGVWGYSAVIVRQPGKSVKRVLVTAKTA